MTNKTEITRMDIKEFLNDGYLQEVNRRFFHPLGLALEVITDLDVIKIGGVWDYRNDPEGLRFAEGEIDREKARKIDTLWRKKSKVRESLLGYMIQPAYTGFAARLSGWKVRAQRAGIWPGFLE